MNESKLDPSQKSPQINSKITITNIDISFENLCRFLFKFYFAVFLVTIIISVPISLILFLLSNHSPLR